MTDGPAEGMTIQKTDQRNDMNILVGVRSLHVAVVQADNNALLSLYRETLVHYSHSSKAN